jgi:hypothetical protein
VSNHKYHYLLHYLYIYIYIYTHTHIHKLRVTVAARSKAWTDITCSNDGVEGSNPIRGMDVCVCVCVCVYFVCVILCAGRGFLMGWSPSKKTYWLCKGLRNWISKRAVEPILLLLIICIRCSQDLLQVWSWILFLYAENLKWETGHLKTQTEN